MQGYFIKKSWYFIYC